MKHQDIWVQTWTGRKIYPAADEPGELVMEDIAHHLSLINRYNGATIRGYSVAEHCCLLEKWAQIYFPSELVFRLNLLLHDAAEAYLQDITGPLRPTFPWQKRAEKKLLPKIHAALGVPFMKDRALIKLADMRILLNERAALCPNHGAHSWEVDELDLEPLSWNDRVSIKKFGEARHLEQEFFEVFHYLKSLLKRSENHVKEND